MCSVPMTCNFFSVFHVHAVSRLVGVGAFHIENIPKASLHTTDTYLATFDTFFRVHFA